MRVKSPSPRAPALGAMALGLTLGCSGQLPTSEVVDKLRVLAVRASPPEVAPGQSATIDALVVRPPAHLDLAPPPLSYLWLACTEPAGAQLPAACGVTVGGNGGPDAFGAALDGGIPSALPSCQDHPEAALCLLGVTPRVTLVPAVSVAQGQVDQVLVTLIVSDQDALACAVSAAQGSGAPPDPDHCIIAIKRLTVSHSAAPNHNPQLHRFDLGGRSLLDGTAAFVPPSAVLASVRCTSVLYMDPGSCSPGAEECCLPGSDAEIETDNSNAVESLYVSWFTTAGSLSDSRTLFQVGNASSACLTDPQQGLTIACTNWTVPTAGTYATGDEVLFWAVVRDDRGGVGWLRGTASAP